MLAAQSSAETAMTSEEEFRIAIGMLMERVNVLEQMREDREDRAVFDPRVMDGLQAATERAESKARRAFSIMESVDRLTNDLIRMHRALRDRTFKQADEIAALRLQVGELREAMTALETKLAVLETKAPPEAPSEPKRDLRW